MTSPDETTKQSNNKPFTPEQNWELLSQGAEARIWKIPNYDDKGTTAIAKERFAKKYRHPVLDERLTKLRCRMEARMLEKCKKSGIDTAQVLRVESGTYPNPAVLYLEYIEGKTVRDYLEDEILPELAKDVSDDSMYPNILHNVAVAIGSTIAQFHNAGMIHGDLTTSNLMLRNDVLSDMETVSITLLDFGLAKNSPSSEERAVDLYVLERALESTHPTLPESFWSDLEKAYSNRINHSKQQDTLSRLEQVRQRGRKRECFG
jgi:TP53 regulating kinase-like protein